MVKKYTIETRFWCNILNIACPKVYQDGAITPNCDECRYADGNK